MSSNRALPISDSAAPVWPKRASKACASCRRDKIRCDGSRPCTGCSRKGYTADQCTEGCEPCRRARVRCEEGKPCPRCGELGLECTSSSALALWEQELLPASSHSASSRHQTFAASSKSGMPRIGDRAKLACSNCRRDNKKCDDQRPCSRCVARSEECIHLPRGPKLIKLRCETCRTYNRRCEETRPCQYCMEIEQTCVTATRKGRGHGTRVKAACVGCRRDKIRCNGDRPCAACTKKGSECIERACQACADEGKGSECTHRRAMEARAASADAEGNLGQLARADDQGALSSGPFHTFREVPLMVNGHLLPQWESHVPGPHSHPLHPMYPTTVPQAQYYFPPQQVHHPTSTFPMSENLRPSPSSGSQATNYYASDISRSHYFDDSSTSHSSNLKNFHPARGPGDHGG